MKKKSKILTSRNCQIHQILVDTLARTPVDNEFNQGFKTATLFGFTGELLGNHESPWKSSQTEQRYYLSIEHGNWK